MLIYRGCFLDFIEYKPQQKKNIDSAFKQKAIRKQLKCNQNKKIIQFINRQH